MESYINPIIQSILLHHIFLIQACIYMFLTLSSDPSQLSSLHYDLWPLLSLFTIYLLLSLGNEEVTNNMVV